MKLYREQLLVVYTSTRAQIFLWNAGMNFIYFINLTIFFCWVACILGVCNFPLYSTIEILQKWALGLKQPAHVCGRLYLETAAVTKLQPTTKVYITFKSLSQFHQTVYPS